MIVWLAKTETGDLNELNVSGGGQLFLDKIRKTTNSKPLQADFDFYERALLIAKYADIIINKSFDDTS